jgi:hypothetical protein
MDAESHVPELIVVRVISRGTPFKVGDDLSVAYTTPTMGRLVPHGVAVELKECTRYVAVVPDAFSARVTIGSRTYDTGELLSFSFVDPRFARIHRLNGDHEDIVDGDTTKIVDVESRLETISPVAEPLNEVTDDDLAPALSTEPRAGVRVRMEWSIERARRFVQIVDKLFTVDRLGWYRHALAMRLLVPDTIECSDGEASAAATTHLQMLRAAAIAALGRPLLAACMPAFAVTVEWLETVDTPEVARALAGLRSAITPFVCDEVFVTTSPIGESSAVGFLRSLEIRGDASASADAFLATLVPHVTADPLLSERLRAYREALCDVFAQTARTTELVRLGRMSEPNHVLDDRLWQLAGVVGKTLGGLAVA